MKSKNLHVGGWKVLRISGLKAWIPAAAWAAAIFVLSSFPGSAYPASDVPAADKIVHVFLYAPLAALAVLGLRRTIALGAAAAAVAGLLATSLYGLSDEFHQSFVPGRNSDWHDLVADALGALLGALVMTAILRRRRASEVPPVR
jgi:VanZ family protein